MERNRRSTPVRCLTRRPVNFSTTRTRPVGSSATGLVPAAVRGIRAAPDAGPVPAVLA
jgi:hypothetical protein